VIASGWKTAVKWAWVLLVATFAGYYAVTRHELIQESLARLGWLPILGAALGIILAKLALVENMRLAARRTGERLPLSTCFCIYNLTQLAKYVPGSVWQFVSRIAILRGRGWSVSSIRDSILAEHAWVLATALVVGSLFVALSDSAWLMREFGTAVPSFVWVLSGLAGLAVLVGARSSAGRRLLAWAWSLRPGGRAIGVLFAAWVFLGTAFWFTLVPFSAGPVPWAYFVGVYCLAYLVGFLVPFAPAGLGAREAVLVAGAGPLVGVELAIFLAAVNRILYVLMELGLAAPCLGRGRSLVT